MKKLFATLLLVSTILSADIKLSPELLDGNINTEQYQLFITNTMNIPIDGLEAREVYFGSKEGYYKTLSIDIPKNITRNIEAIKSSVRDQSSIGAILDYWSASKDDEYMRVVDYYFNSKIQTRVISYIVSADELSTKEQMMIYSTTNDTSYHYNEGFAKALVSSSSKLLQQAKGNEI